MAHPGLQAVRKQIAEAARAAGRDPASIRLIVVSKTFGADAIRPVIADGQRVFGENRVQEAKTKWPQLVQEFPDLSLHLIGPLQSNKAAEAVAMFSAIHTVDRPKIAEALAGEMGRQNRTPDLFVQVNTGREPQKAGVMPEQADQFLADCQDKFRLKIAGLMCIPPAADDPKPHFEALVALGKRHGLEQFSMGMSGDFELAIACGATHVRIGSAIFGHRA
jgi:pyridoxal phosphate enzyme (YggS family)